MKPRVSISAKAEAQANAIDLWWHTHRRDAPDQFWSELVDAIDVLREAPWLGEAYPRGGPGVRRLLLSKVRYHLYYTVDGAEPPTVVIVTVWNAVRGQPPDLDV